MEDNKVEEMQNTSGKVFPNNIIKNIVIVCCVLGGLLNLAFFALLFILFFASLS